jgi:hypothetical protein
MIVLAWFTWIVLDLLTAGNFSVGLGELMQTASTLEGFDFSLEEIEKMAGPCCLLGAPAVLWALKSILD